MAVYRGIRVPIPESHVTIERQPNGKPSLIKYVLLAPYNRDKGYPEPKRTTIGHQCEDSRTMMNPTTQYKEIFPEDWAKVSGEKVVPSVKRFGLFTVCQAVNTKTGLKDILDEVYGTGKASGIIDFALYSVLHHTDTAQMFGERMRNEMLYSKEPLSDSAYSSLFENGMTSEQELQFKKKWALRCKEDGAENVWLCIDGSNDDCRSTGVELAEKGHAKSGKNINIVSYTYAVTPEGKPVTWEVYQGGLVDAKAMKKVIDFLSECGIEIKGVILDRGYCDSNSIRYLAGKGLSYVIMIKGHPDGYETVVSKFGRTIKMNAEYLVPGTCLFGIQQSIQLFSGLSRKDHITLFFDYQNGGERVTSLLKNLYSAMGKAEKQIRAGKAPEVDEKYKTLISAVDVKKKDGSTEKQIRINTGELQKAIDEKGLYGIVTSDEMTPSEVHKKYASRSASETQFMFIKTQLGYGVVRVQYTPGVLSRFMEGFVASVIRYEIEQSAGKLGRTANQMILEADRLEMQKLNGVYTYSHTETARVRDFLKGLGVKDVSELIDESVKYENDRMAGRTPVPRHRKTGPKKGSHHKKYDAQGNAITRKPGVKPGTRRQEVNADGTARRKPGVKPGTVRGKYNLDGSLRKKPGPKPGSHRVKTVTQSS